MPTIRENLIAAKALIDTPEKWIKGAYRNGDCYCTVGALRAVIGRGKPFAPEKTLLGRFIPEGWSNVVRYNDHPDTTHSDIMELFQLAIDSLPA